MSTKAKIPHAAFVLAAGLGTRMREMTRTIPKPMVPLLGVPLVDRVLDRIADAGIATAVVNVHYCADVLETHLAHRTRPKIVISDERGELLDTGGGVMKAWPRLKRGPFLIHNSDSVWIEGIGSNLDRLIRAFDPATMDSLLLLAPIATSLGYDGSGDFVLASDGRLTRRTEGRPTPFAFTGVSIAHPRLFAEAPQGPFSLNMVWNRAIEKGRLHGLRLDGIWMHVGTPEAVAAAERRLADAQDHNPALPPR